MINNNVVRGIVGVIVGINIIFLLYLSYGLFDSINSLNELYEPYTMYDEQEESIERLLKDNNYEVLNVHISNYSGQVMVAVEMKSLGSRNDQIMDALISMGVVYESAFTYRIEIKSPTDTCNYLIFGDTYRNYTANHTSKSYELLQSQIDEYEECS